MPMKTISLSFACLFAVLFWGCKSQGPMASSRLSAATDSGLVEMHWLASPWSDRAAMLVPIHFEGIERPFYLQFDVGASRSKIYTASLEAMLEKYPAIGAYNSDSSFQTQFSLGQLPLQWNSLELMDHGKAPDLDDPESIALIGMMGTDVLEGRVLSLDFFASTLQLQAAYPEPSDAEWSPYIAVGGRILLPGKVAGQEQNLMYDSGSSAFEFITDEATSRALAEPDSPVQVYATQAWGKQVTTHTIAVSNHIEMNGQRLPIHSTTWVEGVEEKNYNSVVATGMGGMLGNSIFRDYVLVIDDQQQRFMIRPGSPE